MEYRGNVSLVDYPDARRIDINQTLRDPAEQIQVRIFNQKNSTPIYALCDLSGSMRFKGTQNKLSLAAEIAASIAYSAHQAGDRFSFLGFDQVVREDWIAKPSYRMQDAYALIKGLANYQPLSVGAEGLLDINRFIGPSRGLIFMISDFHMPFETIEQALNMFSNHHVVPVVLWDADEYRNLPNFGFSTIIDPETGELRTLFFRESLKRRFAESFSERKAKLKALFSKYETPACFVEDYFIPGLFSEYFHEFSAL